MMECRSSASVEEAIMKCKFCQGVGELIVVEEVDGSTDELIDMRPCENCQGTGEVPADLGGRAPSMPPPVPPAD